LRHTSRNLARILVALAFIVSEGCPAGAATITTQVTANNLKPLLLAKLQDLDLGTVTLGPGTWSNATVSISQGGTLSCLNANITCAGAIKSAQYNVQGSNQQTVYISCPNITLVNQNDSTQALTLVTNAPTSILLTNAGFPGTNFSIGGSVTINSTTSAGTYVGTFNVTVNY
jgi:Domain of unknown function (DUF4402)